MRSYDPSAVTLLRDSPNLCVDSGLEVVDANLTVLGDISDELSGGEVARQAYADIHGSATFELTRELNWGSAMVRPYVTISDTRGLSQRFNLGVYFTSIPQRALATKPIVYQVAGFDVLLLLQTPIGAAYSVAVGAKYLDTVESILSSLGVTKYRIDPEKKDLVLPAAKVFPLDEQTTWLTVVNTLLNEIGYRGIYTDWDGYFICDPYRDPSSRPSEWTYDTGQYTSMVSVQRLVTHDYFEAPNRWVAVRTNNAEGTTPVEGAGIFTYVNEFGDETSVTSRGRIITKVMGIDAADQPSLELAARRAIEADRAVSTIIEVETSPNPLHWHFDRLTYNDPDYGPATQVMGRQWTLALDGSRMSQSWGVVS